MPGVIETDDSFEILASTLKSIYDQTCPSCGLSNRMLIFMPNQDGTRVRKIKIDHKLGEKQARQSYERAQARDKRQSQAEAPPTDKCQRERGWNHSCTSTLFLRNGNGQEGLSPFALPCQR